MSPQRSARTRRWAGALLGGSLSGVVAGLFGVGGGILFVAVLAFGVGTRQHEAHATALVAVVLAALGAAWRFALVGAVAWAGAVALTVGAVAGAYVGARILPRFSERGLMRLFAMVLTLVALRFLVFGDSGGGSGETIFVPALGLADALLHGVAGLLAGVVSSVLGLGGGIIFVPTLAILFGYGQHAAEGTSLAVIVPTALAGAISHRREGYTRWGLGLEMGVGGVAGGLLGAQLALSLPPEVLARLYGVFTGALAVVFLQRSR